MGIASAFMNQNIDSVYSVSIDGRGNKTTTLVYSDIKCRWQSSLKRVLNRDNEISIANIEVWIPASYTIEYDYQIVKGSTTYRILRKEDRYNIAGNLDHIKLYLV